MKLIENVSTVKPETKYFEVDQKCIQNNVKAKVTILCDANDLTKYGYNGLIGFFLTHVNLESIEKPMLGLMAIEEVE